MAEEIEEKEAVEANWTCPDCGMPCGLSPGTRYHRCEGCESLYRLAWRAGKLDISGSKALQADLVDSRLATEVLQERALRSVLILRELNTRIRNLEMSKGGERLFVFTLFIIICVIVYGFFHFTVVKNNILQKPSRTELILLAITGFALAIVAVQRLRRKTIMAQVRKLHQDKDTAESDLESSEAALAIRGESLPIEALGYSARLPDGDKDDDAADIIGKFVSKQRARRQRLSLRSKRSSDRRE